MRQPEHGGYVRPSQDERLRRTVPKEISWIAFGLIILVAFHLITTVIMVLQREAIAEGIRKANPSLSDLQVAYALAVTLVVSALFHAIFVQALAEDIRERRGVRELEGLVGRVCSTV